MSEDGHHDLVSLGAPIPPDTTNRVKVYRLRENDWDDLGTGLCGGFYDGDEPCIQVIPELRPPTDEDGNALAEERSSTSDGEAIISSSDHDTSPSEGRVEDGDKPAAPLLAKRISIIRVEKKEETFIVMDEDNHVPITLSFETAEGCDTIWEFLVRVKKHFSPDPTESGNSTPLFVHSVLPIPQLGNLDEIENIMRAASTSHHGRHELVDSVVSTDYLDKLVPLVAIAEEAHSITDLRHLCNIMKLIIFLNDSIILERVVRDEYIDGVMGALEYDAEFGNFKATHREYLKKHTFFKQVVPFAGDDIPQRIRSAHRLQYLKDVALARVLDGFTFSVVNTLIFFNQVGILEYLQKDANYVRDLFAILSPEIQDVDRQRDALRLVQQCCHLAKSQQVHSRNDLFFTFINGGLFKAIAFSLRSEDLDMRVAGTDILNTMVEQEPALIQTRLFHINAPNTVLLSDVVIECMMVETDMGVKSQMSDIIKVIFNPEVSLLTVDPNAKSKLGTGPLRLNFRDSFLQIYARSAQKLFEPFKDLKDEDFQTVGRDSVSLYIHLLDILCFFVKCHSVRTSYIVLTEELAAGVVRLLKCPSKHVKVAALRFFRTCISIPEITFTEPLLMPGVFEGILDVVYETMPRDTLLNSACLEIFEHIRRDGNRPLISHLVRNHRQRLEGITYVTTFQGIISKYDLMASATPAPKAVVPSVGPIAAGGDLLSQQPVRGRLRANSQIKRQQQQQQQRPQHQRLKVAPLEKPSGAASLPLHADSDENEDDEGDAGLVSSRNMDDEDDDDTYFSCLEDEEPVAPPMLAEPELMDDPVPRSLMKPLVSYPDDDDDDEDDDDQDGEFAAQDGLSISDEGDVGVDDEDGDNSVESSSSSSLSPLRHASPPASASPPFPAEDLPVSKEDLGSPLPSPLDASNEPLSPPRSSDAIVPLKRRHGEGDEDKEGDFLARPDGQSKRRNSNGLGCGKDVTEHNSERQVEYANSKEDAVLAESGDGGSGRGADGGSDGSGVFQANSGGPALAAVNGTSSPEAGSEQDSHDSDHGSKSATVVTEATKLPTRASSTKSMPRRLRRIAISISSGLNGSKSAGKTAELSSGTSSSPSPSPSPSPSSPLVHSGPISGSPSEGHD